MKKFHQWREKHKFGITMMYACVAIIITVLYLLHEYII